MCFFITLKITPQRKADEAEAALARLASGHGLHLRGVFPVVQVTDGHCSCGFVVEKERAVSIAPFLAQLSGAPEVKSVHVGWAWGGQMPIEANVERLSVQEFLTRNAQAGLALNTWYRLHDAARYVFVSE